MTVFSNDGYINEDLPGQSKKSPNSYMVSHESQRELTRMEDGVENEEDDPWALSELVDTGPKWSELSTSGKIKQASLTFIKVVCLLGLLYLFISSLSFLGAAFRLIGGRASSELFKDAELLQNPIVGLMLGVLATVLLQSSSTSTTIVVGMVSAGILEVHMAIPLVMGANIGTSVTNTIVSLTQVTDRNEFRRAFAGATVHDMFNWLTCITLVAVEVLTGYLERLTGLMVESMNLKTNKGAKVEILKVITKPFTNSIIQIDKKVLKAWTLGANVTESLSKYVNKTSILKETCKTKKLVDVAKTISYTNPDTGQQVVKSITEQELKTVKETCSYLFHGWGIEDKYVGIVLLIFSLLLLCGCLVGIVKILNSMLKGKIASIIRKTINADFPYAPWLTGYLAILVGCGMTIIVQSSSIFTSALTPLVGVGVISIERMYPLTLGSNIGTTTTAILASLAADESELSNSIQISLCHLFFNLTGIIIFYVIPFMRVPIALAKILGNTTAKYRWFAVLYLIVMFFILPALAFVFSLAGTVVVMCVFIPFIIIILIIAVINVLQAKKPSILPEKLRTWNFLPLWMHSLQPLDNIIVKFMCCSRKVADENKKPPKAPARITVASLKNDKEAGITRNGETGAVANGEAGTSNTAFEMEESPKLSTVK